jgi:hypothetical protein
MSLAPKEAYVFIFTDFSRPRALYLRRLINHAVLPNRQIVIPTAVRRSSMSFATIASINQSTGTVDNSVEKLGPLITTRRRYQDLQVVSG